MLGPLTLPRRRLAPRGFTLIEMLIVIAVAAILITVAAPSLRDFILVQRLKSVNAQLVTDLQYARSEAVARGQYARLSFRSNDRMTCYSIYTSPTNAARCNCLLPMGTACTGDLREIRSVQIPKADGVQITVQRDATLETAFAFDHIAGGIVSIPTDRASRPANSFTLRSSIDANRILTTTVGRAGRVTVCSPTTTSLGAPAC